MKYDIVRSAGNGPTPFACIVWNANSTYSVTDLTSVNTFIQSKVSSESDKNVFVTAKVINGNLNSASSNTPCIFDSVSGLWLGFLFKKNGLSSSLRERSIRLETHCLFLIFEKNGSQAKNWLAQSTTGAGIGFWLSCPPLNRFFLPFFYTHLLHSTWFLQVKMEFWNQILTQFLIC